MLHMQPLNFQHLILKATNTTNSVPGVHRQRVQAAMIDDFPHPSKYVSPYQKSKMPEFESQDWLINRRPNPFYGIPFSPKPQHFSTDTAALQI